MTRRRRWGALADGLRDTFPPGALDALQARLDALPRCSHCGGIVRKSGAIEPGETRPCPRCGENVCVRCAEHPFPESPRIKGSCAP